MSIRVKLLIACLACALVPLIGYAGYTYARTARNLERLESGLMAARETAVSQALDDAASQERTVVGDTAAWPAFVSAIRRDDVTWLRRQLADLAAGGTAQLFTPGGRLLLSAGPSETGSLFLQPEVQHVVTMNASASGYETLDGRLSIVTAQPVGDGAASQRQAAVLAVARPVDEAILATIGSYAGVSVRPAPQAVTERFVTAATPPPVSNGVLNQFGEMFTQGSRRSAYLGVYDVDGFRSGLVQVLMERSAVSAAVTEIRTVALAALVVALAAAVIAALLLSRRISTPLRELAAAAVGMAGGETRQEIHVRGRDEVGQLAGAFNTMSRRVSEHVTDLSDKLRSLTQELTDVNVVFGETIEDTVDVEAQLPRMLPHVESMMKADTACLYLMDEDGGLRLASGDAGSHATRLEAAGRQAVEAGSAVAVEDAGEGEADGGGLAAAPLTRAGRASGALVVLAHGRRFDAQDVALLSALAGQLALVTQNAEMLERLERSYFSTVTALASAVEAKDGYTADHCRLIAGMAEIVGGRLGLSDADLRLLRYAAILHDIGKTGVPGAVLRSTAPLTAEQSALIADHTVTGESIVARIPYLSPIAPVIRSAHERWDGGGYPDRLRGSSRSRSPRASSSPATPATPWCPTGRTARPWTTRRRSPSSRTRRAPSSIPRLWRRSSPRATPSSDCSCRAPGPPGRRTASSRPCWSPTSWGRRRRRRRSATAPTACSSTGTTPPCATCCGATGGPRSTPPATGSWRRSTAPRGRWSARPPSAARSSRSASRSGRAATRGRSS